MLKAIVTLYNDRIEVGNKDEGVFETYRVENKMVPAELLEYLAGLEDTDWKIEFKLADDFEGYFRGE